MKAKLMAATLSLALMSVVATNEAGGTYLYGQAGDWYSRGLIRQQTINGQSVKHRRRAYEARQRKKAHRRKKAVVRMHKVR